jgi:ABC-type nitrate/sulfonate/bicarbonate transport system substrate-binding protein
MMREPIRSVFQELRMKALLGGLVLAAFAGAASAQETKVAVGISGWTGFAPLTLAKEAGSSRRTAST